MPDEPTGMTCPCCGKPVDLVYDGSWTMEHNPGEHTLTLTLPGTGWKATHQEKDNEYGTHNP